MATRPTRRLAPAPRGRTLEDAEGVRRLVGVVNAGVTTRPRVLFVTARARPELGGIESHVAEIAGRAVERGYDVEVLTTDRSGRLPRREQVAGYTVRRFRALPASRDWYASPGLFWAVLTSRADLVHVQGVHTLVPPTALLAALLRRRKTVLTFHTGGSSSALRRRSRGSEWRSARPAAAAHHAAGGRVALRGRPLHRGHGARRRHGDPQRWRAAATTPPFESGPGLVLSIGRARALQGAHHRAVAALPELLRTRPARPAGDPGLRPGRARAPVAGRPARGGGAGPAALAAARGPRGDGGRGVAGGRGRAAQRLRGPPGGRDGGADRRAPGRRARAPRASPSSPSSAGPGPAGVGHRRRDRGRDRGAAHRRCCRTPPSSRPGRRCMDGLDDLYREVLGRPVRRGATRSGAPRLRVRDDRRSSTWSAEPRPTPVPGRVGGDGGRTHLARLAGRPAEPPGG